MNRGLILCLLLLLATVACAAKNNNDAGDASIEWRLQSLEAGSLSFQEKLAEQRRATEGAEERLGNRIDANSTALRGEIAELRNLVEALEMRVDFAQAQPPAAPADLKIAVEEPAPPEPAAPAPPAPPAPKIAPKKAEAATPEAGGPAQLMYQDALNTYQAGDFDEAREKFSRFLADYPDNKLIPNALYWLGETYYSQKRFAQAILSFKEVTTAYPKDPKAPAALLKIGYAYDQLGDAANADFYLRTLVDEYPGSEPAVLARERLKLPPG